MKRTKIDFGIDLGTTNSSIAKMQTGEVKIIKSYSEQMDTTPSCVYFSTEKRITTGFPALLKYTEEVNDNFVNYSKGKNEIKTKGHIEFKRTMGTDTKFIDSKYSSEDLSAELLKKLKSYEIDEEIDAIVITIPMMFRQLQRDATLRAAKLAGFQYCELLQEPIAASIAYGLSASNAGGYWLVWDFGGGTFDAALMSADEGIMKVVGTDGDCDLGGKNIDLAIVDEILFPYVEKKYSVEKILADKKGKKLFRAALKIHAENIKKEIARGKPINYVPGDPLGEDDNGEKIELDLHLTLVDVEKAVKPVFQKAIDISLELLKDNNLTGNDLKRIILVGGPTLMQTIRNMLKEQIADKVDVSMNPMTCVAEGAAIFASTKDIPEGLQKRDKSKIQLKIKYPETTVELNVPVGIKIEPEKTEGEIPETVFIEITRSDNAWSSGKIEMQDRAVVIEEVQLNAGKANGFNITLTDDTGNKLECEPNNFTILTDIHIPKAVLERDITIGVYYSDFKKPVVYPIKGLEKLKTLPAIGKTSLKTQRDLNPGNPDDKIEIPLFASKGEKELYSRLELNEQIGEFIITGDDLEDFVPKDTDVQITLELDASFTKKKLTVFFEYTDQTIVLDKDTYKASIPSEEEIGVLIDKAYAALDIQQSSDDAVSESEINQLKNELAEQKKALNNADSKNELKQTNEGTKKILHKIDKLENKGAWSKTEKELKDALEYLENLIEKSGDENDRKIMNEIQQRVQQIIAEQKVGLAKDILQEIFSLQFNVLRKQIGWWISWIKEYDENFDNHAWDNRIAARNELTKAKENIQNKPSLEILEGIVRELWKLLPTPKDSLLSKRDKELLRK